MGHFGGYLLQILLEYPSANVQWATRCVGVKSWLLLFVMVVEVI